MSGTRKTAWRDAVHQWVTRRLADPPPKRGPFPRKPINALTGLLAGDHASVRDAAEAEGVARETVFRALRQAGLTTVTIVVPREVADDWRRAVQAAATEHLLTIEKEEDDRGCAIQDDE